MALQFDDRSAQLSGALGTDLWSRIAENFKDARFPNLYRIKPEIPNTTDTECVIHYCPICARIDGPATDMVPHLANIFSYCNVIPVQQHQQYRVTIYIKIINLSHYKSVNICNDQHISKSLNGRFSSPWPPKFQGAKWHQLMTYFHLTHAQVQHSLFNAVYFEKQGTTTFLRLQAPASSLGAGATEHGGPCA